MAHIGHGTRMQRYKKRERKNIIVLLIFLLAVIMTAAYAAYSRELIIGSINKIYNDWELRFTDIDCEINSEYSHLEYPAFCEVEEEYLEKYITGIEDEEDGIIGGYSLTFVVGFIFPTDTADITFTVTNYSEHFDAELAALDYELSEHEEDYILYDLSELAIGSTVFRDTGVIGNNEKEFTITAYWNPLLSDKVPEGAISIDKETASPLNETYTEERKITLYWVPKKP